MKKLAIEGHKTRGNEVIELLEMLGGKNSNKLVGFDNKLFYYINDKIICSSHIEPNKIKEYEVFSLEKFLEKFPYKVGDKVWLHYENSTIRVTETITHMCWCNKWNCVLYDVYTCDNLRESAFTPYKEKTITIDDFKANTKEWLINKLQSMSKDNALQTICDIYDELHNPKYPKTYEKCCDILLISPYYNLNYITYEHGHYKHATSNILLPLQNKLNTLGKLLICRYAYWKIAGEEMGLDKPWEPQFNSGIPHYSIFINKGEICKDCFYSAKCLLAFPTEEIRDTFYENFKNLIEKCKELL